MQQDHDRPTAEHSHGAGARLDAKAHRILKAGLNELLLLTDGLEFGPLPSEKHPLPLARAVCGRTPSPQQARDDVRPRADSDSVSVLENALVLLELYESNQDDMRELVPEDMPFLGDCFRSKRLNGWIAVLGDGDRGAIESAVNDRWQFAFLSGPGRPTGLYLLLNMLARYAFVYGRIPGGDIHAMGHFIEDHCPGLLVCHGAMSDLELTLSLAAMKLGLPAVVPPDYPFPLGRTLAADTLETISDAVVGFANIRRRLSTPEVPGYPDYCDPENQKEKIEPAVTWGDTDESFYLVRKGTVEHPGVEVCGRPDSALGITVTIEGQPLDAFDLSFIERTIAVAPSMMSGLGVQYADGRLVVDLADGLTLDPQRIGEVLLAAVRHEFPKLTKVHVEVNFDRKQLQEMIEGVRQEKLARQGEIDRTAVHLDGMYKMMVQMYRLPAKARVWRGKAMIFAFLTEEQLQSFEMKFFQHRTGGAYGLCHSMGGGKVVVSCYRGNRTAEFGHMLVHETSHGFIYRYKTPTRLPSWVNEGMADYIGQAMVPASEAVARREKQAIERMQITRNLGGDFFSLSHNISFSQYGIASSLTAFMIRTNKAAYVRFIEEMKEGVPWDEALKNCYDVTPEELVSFYGRAFGVPDLKP